MAKRKRGGAQAAAPRSEEDYRPGNSKLSINTFEDVLDSEDEFHLDRDKVLLEDDPYTKARLKAESHLAEVSDDEVLGYSDSQDSEGEEEAEGYSEEEPELDDQETGEAVSADEDEDLAGWGDTKADYYNADTIQTEEEALAEEQEARRLQQKRRKALTEADFAFDEDDWRADDVPTIDDQFQDGVYTEALPKLQITEDMSSEDRLDLLGARYPEFGPLSQEFIKLRPLHAKLFESAQESANEDSLSRVKLQALSSYLGSLALYFALLTSGDDGSGGLAPLAPHLLRDHDIMTTLVRCRVNWAKVQDLQLPSPPASDEQAQFSGDSDEVDERSTRSPDASNARAKKRRNNNTTVTDEALAASLARRAARLRATEASLASLDAELAAPKKRKATSRPARPTGAEDVDSDIGDEPTLNAHEAAEKAHKKRSLRFYTSQIAQKANKRANAGRAAGGDDDLPRRERLRDRQERLMKEAQKRGQEQPDVLGQDSADEDETNIERESKVLATVQDGDDDYAQQLLDKVSAKKADKRARSEAYANAREQGGQVERHVADRLGPDGRREIGYQIQKNKGLTPKRSKDVKNPRVKKRRKFEEKKKKLASIKPVYKGGEGRGGYGGELTGIKKGIVRSVKL